MFYKLFDRRAFKLFVLSNFFSGIGVYCDGKLEKRQTVSSCTVLVTIIVIIIMLL
jgi:hypothetical protein